MGNSVADYKAKPPRITGVITINHARRVKMGLGPLAYILMDTVAYFIKEKKPITVATVYVRTGLIEQEQKWGFNALIERGYLFPPDKDALQPTMSDKWDSHFKSIEDEFEDFWTKDGKVCWQGPKSKAQDLYVKLRVYNHKDYLMKQRNEYFRFLDLVEKSQNFKRAKMMATVFLGPQERYKEEWTRYCTEEEEKIKKDDQIPEAAEEKPSTKTKADRLKKYED